MFKKSELSHSYCAVLAVLFLFCAPLLGQTTITVTSTADSGPGSLREAVASATSGDTIDFNLAYPATITLSSTLVIGSSLTIHGPGASSLAVSGNHSVRVFNIGGGLTVSVSGLTIENGSAPYNNDYLGGGGILNSGTLTLTDCSVSGNAAFAGGGIFNSFATLTLINSTVSGNSATGEVYSGGGGIFTYYGTVTLNNSTVSGNTVTNEGYPPGGGSGGGIHNYRGTLTVAENSVVSNNSVLGGGSGGGIFNGATLTLSDSRVSDNSASSEGAGIYNGGPATLTNSTVSGNYFVTGSFGWAGGGIKNNGPLTLTNSTVSGNSSHYYGGGIFSYDAVTLINSTLSDNSAGWYGGGITNYGTLKMSNSTLSGNIHGAILQGFGGTLTLKNTILANSIAVPNCYGGYGGSTSGGHNLSDDESCAVNLLTAASDKNNTPAGLDPSGLQDNGGPTQTIALLATSPALDAVPITACTDIDGNAITTDQRGIARPQGPACDIGAFEYPSSGFTPVGSNIGVQPVDSASGSSPVTLIFSTVIQAGTTTLTTSGTGAPPPTGFKLGTPPTYFNLNTTAVFSGTISICVNYSGLSFGNSSKLRLFHHQGAAWVDVTASVNAATNTICGSVTSLSPFAVFESAYSAAIQPPIGASGSSVFNASRGVVPVKFTLTLDGQNTCDLPPATVALTRTFGGVLGAINESDYALAADFGSNFRTSNCQYVYNLATGSLGVGTYRADIVISGIVVGSATFGLK